MALALGGFAAARASRTSPNQPQPQPQPSTRIVHEVVQVNQHPQQQVALPIDYGYSTRHSLLVHPQEFASYGYETESSRSYGFKQSSSGRNQSSRKPKR